jgi:hypothetical protein
VGKAVHVRKKTINAIEYWNLAWPREKVSLDQLHQQGYITDPRGKAKSVVFTEEGFERSKRLLEELFSRNAEPNAAPGRGGS